MKRSFAILAIGAALLPLGLSQPASAHDWYGRDSRLERDIARDRHALHRDYAKYDYDTFREREAVRHGNFLTAWWFKHLRNHEERLIERRRADIHRDHERMERHRY
jgi:hypothetical protein